jgi:hypothetical protein
MPRPQAVPLGDALVLVPKGGAAPAPQPGRRAEPPGEKRVALTFRFTPDTYEWLRRTTFDARVSQQALVDQALGLLRAQRSHG